MATTVPPDEWIELVSDVEDGTYDVDVVTGDVDLKRSATPPSQQSDGILAWAGANLPFNFDGSTNKKLWARATDGTASTVRVNPGPYPRKQRRDSRTTSVVAEDLKTISKRVNENVAAGAPNAVQFTPPEGYIWDIQSMRISVTEVISATSGQHSVEVSSNASGGHTTGYVKGGSTYDTRIMWEHSAWKYANNIKEPADSTTALLGLQNARLDTENNLSIVYLNQTDAVQDNEREYDLRVRELRVA